jgi:uncharacterized protein (DUF1778 family)
MKDVIELVVNHLTGGFDAFIQLLMHFKIAYEPVRIRSREPATLIVTSIEAGRLGINPKLWPYTALCIAFGTTITSFFPGKPKVPDLATSILVLVPLWLLFGLVAHAMLSEEKIKIEVAETTTAMLHIAASLHVVNSLATFLVATAVVHAMGIVTEGERLGVASLVYFLAFAATMLYYTKRVFQTNYGARGRPQRKRLQLLVMVLLVMGILAVLASMLFPVFAKAREMARSGYTLPFSQLSKANPGRAFTSSTWIG